jgi:glyoxylase-like metal-dependent hydrolase (beta-lactamase superfamily II)
MPEHRELDLRHLGTPRVICCHTLDDQLVDPGPESAHRTLLEALGDLVPRRILLTHIHFDHAGATGRLVERWPDVEVWVHERGAPHLVDPARLVKSARRLYGDDFDRLWGEVVPVPERNLRVLRGGEREDGFRVEYTPGHASHHVAYFHEQTGLAFAGDVAGVRIDGGRALAPTPPPDVDVDAWHASIDVLRGWDPGAVCITHFGTFTDVTDHLDTLEHALDEMAAMARDTDDAAFRAWIRERIEGAVTADVAESYFQAMPPETLHAGLERYWRKRAEREAAAEPR